MVANKQHPFRKRWGQNFLADPNLIRKIVRTIDLRKTDSILEIGPGEGVLTEKVLPVVNEMAAVEIDPKLINYLREREDLSRCHLIHKDILWQSLDELPISSPIKVIGNIPYNITSPILFWLIEQRSFIKEAFFMVQKEMADRLTGSVGTKSYGRLTVMVGAFLNVQNCFTIPPEVFIPRPKVKSAIIKLTKHEFPMVSDKNVNSFEKIVEAAFSRRRKMLRNTLSGFGFSQKIMDEIDFTRRPETLTIEEFSTLSKDL